MNLYTETDVKDMVGQDESLNSNLGLLAAKVRKPADCLHVIPVMRNIDSLFPPMNNFRDF